ncbi:MAG: membrane dipeptidase [Calditrichaeota bacterium]|nr:dipeptidase [Calditrichota bacterium]RQW07485.1 MAG: membrane dipeptidase [Calditrichota bacterium]
MRFIFPVLLFFTLLLSWNHQKEVSIDQAMQTAHNILILDSHIDLPYMMRREFIDLSVRRDEGHFDYVRAREGGLNVPFIAAYISPSYEDSSNADEYTHSQIDLIVSFQKKWPDKFMIVKSPEEINQKGITDTVMIVLCIENGTGLEGLVENVEHFYQRGVRYMTLIHSKHNRLGDSSFEEGSRWDGLSPFGEKVVREMNRLGMMVDVSHASDGTFYDIMEISQAPVIATHSACRHFTPGFERNLTDGMIQMIARKGGVVQIPFGSFFIVKDFFKISQEINVQREQFMAEHRVGRRDSATMKFVDSLRTLYSLNPGTLSDVVDHIEHVIKLVGVDHVGLGSDFEGVSMVPEGVEDVSGYPNIIRELMNRGYSDEDIQKICSGNFLRVWSEVRRVAESGRQESHL